MSNIVAASNVPESGGHGAGGKAADAGRGCGRYHSGDPKMRAWDLRQVTGTRYI